MSGGTYENEVRPIKGGVFLDRTLGWLSLVCALPVLVLAVYWQMHPALLPVQPGWVQPVKIFLIVLALLGICAVIASRPGAIRLALWLYLIRTLALFVMYPWSGGPRFWGTELAWNLVVIWYCWMRLKTIDNE